MMTIFLSVLFGVMITLITTAVLFTEDSSERDSILIGLGLGVLTSSFFSVIIATL